MAAHQLRGRGVSRPVLVGTLLLATVLSVGCFGRTKKDKPVDLVKMTNRIEVQRVWKDKVSGEAPKLRLGLDLAVDGTRVFGASFKNGVTAYDAGNGRVLWHRSLKLPLAGGPAVGDGLVVVGSSKGDVVALGEEDGHERWRTSVHGEILAAPAIDNGLVAVRAVDGKLYGLSATNGTQLWVADQQVPRLTLRGTSSPLIVGDLVISGFDNGRLMAVLRSNGTTAWDAAVGQAHGSTELQRLIDVDAPIISDGDDLFAAAYQGRVARLTRETGQTIWAHEISTYRGFAIDSEAVYVSTAEGDVVRLDRQTGAEQWRQKALRKRALSAPVLFGGHVVVADKAGVVHWLDAATGDFLARAQTGKGVNSEMQVAGDLLLVFNEAGIITAFKAGASPAAAAGAPASNAPADSAAPPSKQP